MLFADLVRTSAAVAGTSSRLAKIGHIAGALTAASSAAEVELVVRFLAGELRQRRTGVGYASLRAMPEPADTESLTVTDIDEAFERLSAVAGAGSQAERKRLLAELTSRATADEQRFLIGLVAGELRQGALDGIMLDAVIRTSGQPAAEVRRAVMVAGAIPPVAAAALGGAGLDQFSLAVGGPLKPMLASPAPAMADALDKIDGAAAVEWKLDGIRVQVHRDGDEVRVFTRTLDEITPRLPEVVEEALSLPAKSLILDGEVIALDPAGRARPFQVTASRTGSRTDVAKLRETTPLSTFFFDILHADGTDLLARSGTERWEALESLVPEALRVPRIVTADLDTAQEFFADAVKRGHEGVVVKSLEAPYDAGRRGAAWIKVKPRHTLDLVVLAVEWGHGRRTGLLSNLHLGARDAETGAFVMLGKTFKGLTDELLRWQTERFRELQTHRDDWTVYVRPEQVVEIAFDGVQGSTRYPGGMALRFARVLRYREDKTAAEADTVQTVRMIHQAAGGTNDHEPANDL